MPIGNSISLGTKGRYIYPATSSVGGNLPGPKTNLTLKEITQSSDSSGMPTSPDAVTVQTMNGVLRPTSAREKEEWQRVGVRVDYAFYVSPNEFTSDANLAKLVEKNVFASATKTYKIVGILDNSNTQRGQHYKVYLEELK